MKIFDVASHELESFEPEELIQSLDSEHTVVAAYDAPALEIAEEVDQRPESVVVVVNRVGRPIGFLDPQAVLRALDENKGIRAGSLAEGLRHLEADPEERALGFHHEWLNHARPEQRYCEEHDHWVYGSCDW